MSIATVPSAPRSISIIEQDAALSIEWVRPLDDGGSPVLSYEVVASPGGASCTSVAPTTACVIDGLENGTRYTISITAVNAIGVGPASTNARGTPRPDGFPPTEPQNVSVVPGDYSLEVSWDPPVSDGGNVILEYVATAVPVGGGDSSTCTVDFPVTTCTITGLENDAEYAVTVTAINFRGSSPDSIAVTDTTLDAVAFILVVNTELGYEGSGSNASTVQLPLFGENQDLRIDWGGDHQDCPEVWDDTPFDSEGVYCTYDAPGVYTIKISGTLERFGSDSGGSYQQKIIAVNTFGRIGLTSLQGGMYNADFLTTIPTELPPTVTNIKDIFASISTFDNPTVVEWDVSNVTVFDSAFYRTAFNQDISGWNVSNGTSFKLMFRSNSAFNQNLNDWDFSSATSLDSFFSNANSFNNGCEEGVTTCPVVWTTTTNVTDFSWVFEAESFNQKVTIATPAATTMVGMFYEASVFNNGCDSGVRDDDNCGLNLNTSNVTTFREMFADAEAFNQSVEHWNTGNVTDMESTFEGAVLFNQSLGGWNVGSVTNFSRMFNDADSFNQNLNDWDVSSATDISSMFRNNDKFNNGCAIDAFTCPLEWDTSSAETLADIFHDATAFGQDLPWDVRNVTNLYMAFREADNFNGDISGWVTASVTNMNATFLENDKFNGNIGSWDVSQVTTMYSMFGYATAFNGDISGWITSNVTDMRYMFMYAAAFNGDISGWNTSSVTDMRGMFQNATSFAQDLRGWCVTNLPTPPSNFAHQAPSLVYPPVWGTCPTQ